MISFLTLPLPYLGKNPNY
uniref:Uncharacterized protein n=1 Tax=Arundo donax TaxID=35708 RepID=A0A0A9D8X2_ARUDO